MLLFYLVALCRRYKVFLVLFGWLGLFVFFHVFWYYTYERFMVPAIPAMALLAAYLFQSGGDLVFGTYKMSLARREWSRCAADRLPVAGEKLLAVAAVCAGLLGVAGGFYYTMWHEVGRAQDVVKAHNRALADDNGGKALPKVAG